MEFVDLAAQYARYKEEIDAGISGVLAHGRFIMGPEVAKLEEVLPLNRPLLERWR